ncbi:MAG TPA: FAD-dependent oxidoreductase [Pyrinomonadaceae bacterium]|jgi:2-polyprenyl-6-methoxyphenol hydroxylase-like FAD-dependent oxidoreductase|nr:FAD-dependent oxidoreductase [Pyrinomonadaceae bacterium]
MSLHEHHGVEGQERKIVESVETRCCVVGAGPAGALLALVLARNGVGVCLLEAHEDFDRDFRGDTLHPSAMEIMDELGLADALLTLRHTKIRAANVMTGAGAAVVAEFKRLKTRFPYITIMPQSHFIEFLVAEAKRYPDFELRLGARVEELIEEGGDVRGVRYRDDGGGWREVRAALTVGADGRGSRVRHLSGLEAGALKTSPPIDVLWFRLPRAPGDPEGLIGRFGAGHAVVMLDRLDEWQVGYIIFKGTYQQVRAAGLDALKKSFAETAPEYAARTSHLKEWKQVSMLSVESSRLKTWYRAGLLLIGDAAHVMSPVGGVGINYAIQDAVAAANVLAEPLRGGVVTTEQLRRVQRERALPTRIIQAVQAFVQRRVIGGALRSRQSAGVPFLVRLVLRTPFLRDLPPRLIAFGFRPAHLRPELRGK